MTEHGSERLSDEQVDSLVGLLGTAPIATTDAASRLLDVLVPLARQARARDRQRGAELWQLIGGHVRRDTDDPAGRAGPRVQRVSGALVVTIAVTVTVILAAALLLGVGGRPALTPATAVPSPSPTLASAGPSAAPSSLAPFGYPGSGSIVYTSHDGSGNDVLWLVGPSGADPTVVARGGCCGLFSPDGSLLAFGAPGVAPPGTTRDPSLLGIQVLHEPGNEPAFVVPSTCGACAMLGLNLEPDAWSPDGRYMAVAMWSDSDPSTDGLAIADREFPWGWPRAATGGHADIPVAFSPDSSELLFLRTERTAGPTSVGPLFVLRIRDFSVRQVSPAGVTASANGLLQGPGSWSPDGQTIAFVGRDEGTGRTSILAVDASGGSSARSLVDNAPGATSARFSPDGSLIVFDQTGPQAPFHDLMIVRPDGSGLTDLTPSFGPGVCCGQWSPDGRALLVAGTASDDAHSDLFVVAADGGGVWQVTNDPDAYSAFLWGVSPP